MGPHRMTGGHKAVQFARREHRLGVAVRFAHRFGLKPCDFPALAGELQHRLNRVRAVLDEMLYRDIPKFVQTIDQFVTVLVVKVVAVAVHDEYRPGRQFRRREELSIQA